MYRKSTYEDCEQIYGLICEMENKALPYDRFREIYQKQLLKDNYYCLIYESENRVIGVLNLRFEEQLYHSAVIAEIIEFAVLSNYRKHGIGKEMFTQACKLAEEFKCIQIEVACNRLRTDTHRFYIREGMCNFHFKFSKVLVDNGILKNIIGK